MDHATTTITKEKVSSQKVSSPAARVVGSLHRGALKEFYADRLLIRPLHDPEPSLHREKHSSSLNDLSSDRPARFFRSEPRRPARRRCTSGELGNPLKLFQEEDNFHNEEFLQNQNTTEAFPLQTDLRRRHKTSAVTWDLKEVPLSEHASLMNSIRQRAYHSPSSQRRAPRSRWVIPVDHWFKTIWDISTVILSIANAHAMHVSIRERKFGPDAFMLFCNVWFLVDMLLNFVTERKTENGEILRDYRSICARYLTSWFVVDALSLMPWETLYVKPIIDLQNRRGFLQKYFFRSKAIVRVTRHLRGRHFRLFGNVAKHTKQHGVGASRLLRLIIKYVPKYVMFARNMKGAVAFRVLRQIQWFRRFYRNIIRGDGDKNDATTGSLTRDDIEESDELSSKQSVSELRRGQEKSPRVQVVYEPWELMNDDDDGVPL